LVGAAEDTPTKMKPNQVDTTIYGSCPYCGQNLERGVCEHWVATLSDDSDGYDTVTPLYFGWIERMSDTQEKMMASLDSYFKALCALCEQVAKKGPGERQRILREAKRLPLEQATLREAINVLDLVDAKDNYETIDDLLHGEFGRHMKDVFADFFLSWGEKVSKIDWTTPHSVGLSWSSTNYFAQDAVGCVLSIIHKCAKATERIKVLTCGYRVPSYITQLESLCMIPDKQGRIDAVAADLKGNRRRFGKIDPSDLEEALDVDADQPSCMSVTWRSSLDECCYDEFPAWENLELLRGRISNKRYEKLRAEGQHIAEGRRTKDITLTPLERRLMEEAIARQEIKDGGGWWIKRYTLRATDGTKVCFQICQGDAGDLFDLVGPYEIHDKGWPMPDGIVIGETW
jgi:hypothetical protein